MTRTKIYSLFIAAFALFACAHVAANQAAQLIG
jgi:hypothetical protein